MAHRHNPFGPGGQLGGSAPGRSPANANSSGAGGNVRVRSPFLERRDRYRDPDPPANMGRKKSMTSTIRQLAGESHIYLFSYSAIRHITMAAITWTTILVPYFYSQVTATHLKIGHP